MPSMIDPRYLTENKSSKCRFQARFVAIENGFVAPCWPSRFREGGGQCVDVRESSQAQPCGIACLIHLNDWPLPRPMLAPGVLQGVDFDFMHL